MKPITTSVYTFANLITGGFVYVDKTAMIREMIRPAFAQCFLARPRRFGKSLTVSTLQAIFEGRRELFKGLRIDSSDYDWKTYPVIRLDMGSTYADTVDGFWSVLGDRLASESRRLGIPLRGETIPGRFASLIEDAAARNADGKVVLLIDEYDKPLLGHLCSPAVNAFRNALKSFYSVIKTTEEFQRFTFITGVSKFSKVSIFSDLNNLTDLTMDARTATLLGYTHDEVRANFPDYLAALGEANGLTAEGAFDRVIGMYDGYRFHHAAEPVVNPVSLGRCLDDREFRTYWYETGTPTFLVDLLKRRPLDLSRLEVPETQLGFYEPSAPELVPLLFQTGYLTIKGFSADDDGNRLYRLGFPNTEVEKSFSDSLAKAYTGVDDITFSQVQIEGRRALANHDLEEFFRLFGILLANLPYDLTDRQNEQTWQAIFVVILRFLGIKVIPEERTNRGRIDAAVEFANEIYVVEMKLDGSAAEAVAQIREKGYHEKYLASGKRVTLLGMNFSSAERRVTEWLAE